MSENSVQQGASLAFSQILESVGNRLLLPLGFVANSQTIIDKAISLSRIPLDLREHESEAQLISHLHDTINTIDKITCTIEWDNETLPELSRLLLIQAITLYSRFCLSRDPCDADHCTYILGVLPQLCDPNDVPFSTSLSLWSTRCDFGLVSQESWSKRLGGIEARTGLADLGHNSVNAIREAFATPAETHSDAHKDVLDSTIASLDRRIKDFDGQSHEVQSTILSSRGLLLQGRFRVTRKIEDIDCSISSFEMAQSLCDPSKLQATHDILAGLSASIHLRHSHIGEPNDLNRAIKIDTELLSHLDFMPKGEKLAILWRHVFDDVIDPSVIDQSSIDGRQVLELCGEGLSLTNGKEHSLWLVLQRIALFRLLRFGKLKGTTDLPDLEPLPQEQDEAGILERTYWFLPGMTIESLWQKLKLAVLSRDDELARKTLEGIHSQGYMTWKSAISLFHLDSIEDVDHAIEVLKKHCLSPCVEGDSTNASTLILVIALWERHRRFGNLQDIRAALSFGAPLGPPGTYGLDLILYSTSTFDINGEETLGKLAEAQQRLLADPSFQPQLKFTGRGGGATSKINEISDGISRLERDQSLYRPPDQPSHHRLRYDQTYIESGLDEDFLVARSECLAVLSSADNDLVSRRKRLHDLSGLHTLRYSRKGEIEDLKHAVNYLWQISSSYPDDDQSPLAWHFRGAWAMESFKLSFASSPVDRSQLVIAQDHLRKIANTQSCSPYDRFTFIECWLRQVHVVWEEDKHNILQMCDLALSLLEEQSWTSSDTRSSINLRYRTKSLRFVIVTAAFRATEDNRHLVTKVLGILEGTQTLVWNQVTRLRAPLDGLASINPELASRLQHLSDTLERRRGLSGTNNPPEEPVDHPGVRNWQLHQERNKVIEEIRTIPGFESFLNARPFDGPDPLLALEQGPVIILQPGVWKAIILHENFSLSYTLPLSFNTLQRWHVSLQRLTGARGNSHETLADDSDGEPSRAGGPRRQRKEGLTSVLKGLWDQVAEPIIGRIMRGGPGSEENLEGWKSNIPKPEDRQRIWWCCLGEFSFMPIHAAGVYGGDTTICVSDFFVSSYTPTFGALINALKRPVPTDLKVLAAVQPNPGRGLSQLPEVKNELAEIVKAVPFQNFLFLGDTTQPDFEGTHTTVENVITKLPEATILHLACHGTQDIDDPLSSGFFLADGEKLTIEDLMKCRLPNAHAAILSACHTASNDAEQPEESANLASALMFLGFSNIIATKWPMHDSDGPIIAREVYRALFKAASNPQHHDAYKKSSTSTPNQVIFSLAEIVDGIVRHLRLVEKVPAEQWATFVHVGV